MPDSSSGSAKMPGWVTLGQIIIGVGAILVLIGFLFGWAAAGSFNSAYSCTSEGCASSDLQSFSSDLGIFFFLAGLGIFLIVGGWLSHEVWPKFQARPRPAPTYTAPVAPAAAPAPAPPPPESAAAPPNCTNCGKPTTYVAQYGRYYCYSCSRYV